MKKKNINDPSSNMEYNVPQGLEYRNEYWRAALKKIRRHERRKFFKKVFCSSVLLVLLITVLFEWNAFDRTNEFQNVANESIVNGCKDNAVLAEASDSHNETAQLNEVENGMTDSIIKFENEVSEDKMARYKRKSTSGKHTIPLKVLEAFEGAPMTVVAGVQDMVKEDVQRTDIAQNNFPITEFGRCYEALTAIKGKELTRPGGAEPSSILCSPSRLNQKRTPSHWGVYVGNNILSDFASLKSDWSWDLAAGVRFQKPIANKWALHTGLEYFTISGIRKPFSISSVAYDANSLRTTTTVETSKLYYLSWPMAVQMKIANSQHVRLGCSISYMITGKNEIKKEMISYQSNTLVESYEDQGYVTGFEDFPVSIDFAYEKKLWRSAFLGLSYHWGITDVTKNEFFNNNSMDRNSRVLLVLGSKI